MTLQKSSYKIQTISYKIFVEFISGYLFRPNAWCRNYYLITINKMTHKSFQLHFKTLQIKYKQFEIVIFSTGVFVRSNTYECICANYVFNMLIFFIDYQVVLLWGGYYRNEEGNQKLTGIY